LLILYGSESSDWDFLHIDEPCPRDMYVANARGLIDRGGSDWFTAKLAKAYVDPLLSSQIIRYFQ
jgi:hypothetical protein